MAMMRHAYTEASKELPPSAESEVTKDSPSSDEDIELLTLGVTSDGTLVTRSQADDYTLRGDELEDLSLLEFISDTYKTPENHDNKSILRGTQSGSAKQVGRPANPRSGYHAKHPKNGTHICVVCTKGHRTITNIVGKWIPSSDDPEQADVHRASILCLLKPWRDISTLKTPEQTWEDAYDLFLQTAGHDKVTMIANAQFYYDCKEAANRSQAPRMGTKPSIDVDDDSDGGEEVGESNKGPVGKLSEEDLEAFIRNQQPTHEVIHGLHAVECAKC
ncbi:uncharacterized protein EI90DRAFT_3137936 [Cantharellus anzutake]|uniref:uncharacterized protein n=1 Tax=Cantharellus anzutake TaxID=1750568 RepID=UPI0019072F7E|nr:uncharacterized protein EI90DRAFT_3137936 [Cantharellus anzutake]KAF8311795.1 hypothetical protein EI90DRAFT_3137936 [Cantharellus anzutake]